jgi:hypothetical protein
VRAPQQTLNERIAANMYALVKPPPCDASHPSAVAKPILDYQGKVPGSMTGDIRAKLIHIVRRVAAFNVVTASKTECKKIAVIENRAKLMMGDIKDLAEPHRLAYRSLLSELSRPRPVTSTPASRERREWMHLKLAAVLTLDLLSGWGLGKISLHEKGQFVRLTAKVYEIATGTKRGASTARRACTEVLDALGLPRLGKIDRTPSPDWTTDEWIAAEEAEWRSKNRADMIRWGPLSELLSG